MCEELDTKISLAPHPLWPLSSLQPSLDTNTAANPFAFERTFTDSSGVSYALSSNTSGSSPADADANRSMHELQKTLQACIEYLREKHLYCMFCVHKYTSHEELNYLCPGQEDDH